jgi:hypothetical protein
MVAWLPPVAAAVLEVVLQNSAGSEKSLGSESVTFLKIQKNSLKTGKNWPKCS